MTSDWGSWISFLSSTSPGRHAQRVRVQQRPTGRGHVVRRADRRWRYVDRADDRPARSGQSDSRAGDRRVALSRAGGSRAEADTPRAIHSPAPAVESPVFCRGASTAPRRSTAEERSHEIPKTERVRSGRAVRGHGTEAVRRPVSRGQPQRRAADQAGPAGQHHRRLRLRRHQIQRHARSRS